MAAITICSDFGDPQNKVWHCFHCFPIYFPWSDGTRWSLAGAKLERRDCQFILGPHGDYNTTVTLSNSHCGCVCIYILGWPKSSFAFLNKVAPVALRCVRSVMSDSLWPHGLQPASLLCSWDFPGKNTGVACQFLLQGIFLTQRWKQCLPRGKENCL